MGIFTVRLAPFFILIQIILSWLYIKKNKKIWLLLILGLALSHYLVGFIFLPRLFTPTNCDFLIKDITLCECRGIKVYRGIESDCYGKTRVWHKDYFRPGSVYIEIENN